MKIAVVGTGTAGILSLSFLLAYPPSPIEVYSIHNPKKPILGVGESTSTQIPITLYDAINFNLLEDSQELDEENNDSIQAVVIPDEVDKEDAILLINYKKEK